VTLAELRFFLPPITPRGVAAFAQAPPGRLLFVQACVAILAGVVVLVVAQAAWFPVIRQAIRSLPERGQISAGSLNWEGGSPVTLATSHFLAVGVNLNHAAPLGEPAHLRVEFGATDVTVCSLLGCVSTSYPRHWRIAFNRLELEPWWGARENLARVTLACVAAVAVWLTWQVLCGLYVLPVWVLASLMNRSARLEASWRISGAALMPGAGVMLLTLGLYGVGMLDVVRFLFGVGLHLVVGWVSLAFAVFFLPRAGGAAGLQKNPFQPAGRRKPAKNPFDVRREVSK
jgi:hypothetical protein